MPRRLGGTMHGRLGGSMHGRLGNFMPVWLCHTQMAMGMSLCRGERERIPFKLQQERSQARHTSRAQSASRAVTMSRARRMAQGRAEVCEVRMARKKKWRPDFPSRFQQKWLKMAPACPLL